MRSRKKFGITLTALVVTLGLIGCAPQANPVGDGPISIVASTNVYGDIARTVGGDRVQVTSIIDDPSQDPHSFEADARVQLALSKAHLVVENGGGYDPFIDQLLSSGDSGTQQIINAVDLSPRKPASSDEPGHTEFNEHVWYDFATVGAVAEGIREALTALDPDNAQGYTTRTAKFLEVLGQLDDRASALRATGEPIGVAVTEPVSLYLLEAVGLNNMTPDAFSDAVEGGTEVSAATMNDTLRLFSDGHARILVYNEQTTSPETEALQMEAVKAGASIVSVSEILPANTSYGEWMNDTLDSLELAMVPEK